MKQGDCGSLPLTRQPVASWRRKLIPDQTVLFAALAASELGRTIVILTQRKNETHRGPQRGFRPSGSGPWACAPSQPYTVSPGPFRFRSAPIRPLNPRPSSTRRNHPSIASPELSSAFSSRPELSPRIRASVALCAPQLSSVLNLSVEQSGTINQVPPIAPSVPIQHLIREPATRPGHPRPLATPSRTNPSASPFNAIKPSHPQVTSQCQNAPTSTPS